MNEELIPKLPYLIPVLIALFVSVVGMQYASKRNKAFYFVIAVLFAIVCVLTGVSILEAPA